MPRYGGCVYIEDKTFEQDATDAIQSTPYYQPDAMLASVLAILPRVVRGSILWGGSVAEWLACQTQAQKGPGSNRSRDAIG